MSATDKSLLLSRLGSLLGFEDGAEDVLEHLLTIESETVRKRKIDRENLSVRLCDCVATEA